MDKVSTSEVEFDARIDAHAYGVLIIPTRPAVWFSARPRLASASAIDDPPDLETG